MTEDGTFPLVTNAIPLYRSKPFVEIIKANIDAIDYPNIEILISDRHHLDDAIDVLEEYFREDPRVTIIRADDALWYAQHYNLLLGIGRGKYFRWMPHDDSYPVCCLKRKVEILESNPQYVLANGPWRKLDSHDHVTELHFPVKSRLGKWSFETALFVAFGAYEAHAFKGLFRRSIAVEREIWLFDTKRIISTERCWEYAMSLAGEFYCLKDFEYYKRYSADSTHATWQRNWKPIDIIWTWYYKFRYLITITPKAGRILAFLLLMVPLTCRELILDKAPVRYHKWIKLLPGRHVKHWMRLALSKL
jgi:GT2 family glycosyltransferase